MRFAKIAVLLLAVTVCCGATWACVGSRPLAMGGAFIGLADDANATYWNPAGLAQLPLQSATGTWMHTSSNRDEINYQDYAAFATCFETSKLCKRMAVGASYVKDNTGITVGGTLYPDTETWLWGSLAADMGKCGLFGVNVRKVDDDATGASIESDIGIDASWLYRVDDRLTIGALAQDVNASEVRVAGVGTVNRIRNYRAGLAFRPSKDTVVTLDAYDIADNGNAQSGRVGIEKLRGNLALRAGYYGLGGNLSQGATFGIGWKRQGYAIDATVLTGDFDNTILISGSFQVL
jgi:hypothetical protein